MPELPEVETIVRDLRKKIIGRKIKSVWFDAPKLIKSPKPAIFQKQIKGLKVIDVRRRAKNILIYLEGANSRKRISGGKNKNSQRLAMVLLIHQKMTGHLLYGKWSARRRAKAKEGARSLIAGVMQERVNDYIHIIFYLDNGWQLALSDLRKFAKVLLGSKEYVENLSEIKDLGPEPLEKNFSFEKFKDTISSKSGKIKQVLMDPYVISGIGNIYSDDILWQAKIHPFRPAKSLSTEELKAIFRAMKEILTQAIKLRGTSISDYRDLSGESGYYSQKRRAYQREGEKCYRCKNMIKRVKMGGRSAHFCPNCQKL